MGRAWSDIKGKRILCQNFWAGTGGDIFANLTGGCSVGTTGTSKHNIMHNQNTVQASGFNSPNKQDISMMFNCQLKYPDKPILENYIQCMYLAGKNLIDSEPHSMWISNHPVTDNDFDIWKKVANNLECNIQCISPVVTTYESYSWAIHILNFLAEYDTGSTEHVNKTAERFNRDLLNRLRYSNDVLRYNHLDDIINNKKYRLFKFCRSINPDIESDKFDFVYNNYRNIRMPLWEKFNKQHEDRIKRWWATDILERRHNGMA